jgi:large subunit ribosomal protein L3
MRCGVVVRKLGMSRVFDNDGNHVPVTLSQGKGFAGAMKRHNFGGMQATHGVSISHRSHGSTGNSQDPGRTWKGKKMAGQYGNVRKTIQNLTVVQLIEEEDLILVKGGVPGSKNNILKMSDAIKHKTPENVPFPGGLKTSTQHEVKVEEMENEPKVSDQNVQNDGDKVEN